jgi:ParB-like chromosome segregation protein Spo0J
MILPLHQILGETRLAYRDSLAQWPGADALRASVQRCGVLEPILLWETEGGLRPVAGFRRIEAARELELPGMPARVERGDPALLRDAFRAVVESHAGQGSTLRERARALRIGLDLGWNLEAVSAILLPALGASPKPHVAAQYLRLLDLPAPLLDFLVAKGYSLRRCLPLCHLRPEEAALLSRLPSHLALSATQFEEVATRLLEISRRDGLPLERVVEELSLLDPSSTQRSALGALERRRLPETSARRETLDTLCGGFLEGRAAVRFDRNLASDIVEVALRVGSVAEYGELLSRLAAVEAHEQLGRILDALTESR